MENYYAYLHATRQHDKSRIVVRVHDLGVHSGTLGAALEVDTPFECICDNPADWLYHGLINLIDNIESGSLGIDLPEEDNPF